MNGLTLIVVAALHSLAVAGQLILLSALVFASLALVVKGRAAIADARLAAADARINLEWVLFDALLVAPVLGIVVQFVRQIIAHANLVSRVEGAWATLGTAPTFVAVVFLGDFVSYWRHRLEHTPWLWPAHAIHHSDAAMTWLTLARFHPLNRATTAVIDMGCLAVLGFPAWALIANEMIRHFYGEFIHADLPWTYGPLGRIFVSPVTHRWHHARDVTGAGSNFATVFTLFDRAFGTYYVPGLCTVPLGVTDRIEQSASGQLIYPFLAWASKLRRRVAAPQPES
jgi:sterol desaturase/sphingolipid hydroxylase (fatty acid hydroxylase superfamily)